MAADFQVIPVSAGAGLVGIYGHGGTFSAWAGVGWMNIALENMKIG